MLSVAAASILLFGLVQDPPDHASLPIPVIERFKFGDVQIEAIVKLVNTGDVEDSDHPRLVCHRRCNGEKHLLHGECDQSCDEACPIVHRLTLRPEVEALVPLMDLGRTKLSEDLKSVGADVSIWTIGTAGAAAARRMIGDNELPNRYTGLDVQISTDCFNQDHCSVKYGGILDQVYRVVMEYKITKQGQPGPSGSFIAGAAYIPLRHIDPGPSHLRCRCIKSPFGEPPGGWSGAYSDPFRSTTKPGGPKLVDEDGVQHGTLRGLYYPQSPPDPLNDMPDPGWSHLPMMTGVYLGQRPSQDLLSQKSLSQLQFNVQAHDMNRATFSASNPYNMPMRLYMPPGTVLEPEDEGLQMMLLIVATAIVVDSLTTTSIDSIASANPPAEGRIMCLEIDKKEPDGKTKYKVVPSHDDVLTRLASMIDKSMLRGPWDQQRLWIYTDGATYGEIEKRLTPTPGPGTYLKNLREVYLAGADLEDKKYSDCFDPALLHAPNAPVKAVEWFARELSRRHAQGLDAWINANAGEFRALVEGPSKDKYAHIAAAARGLARTGGGDSAKAALTLLEKGVPDAGRTEIGRVRMHDVWLLTRSDDKGIRDRALKLIELYNPPDKQFYVESAD